MIDFLALYTLKGVKIKLLKNTKSLAITIQGMNLDGKMSWKVLRSLRQIFNWSYQHVEVESIIIKSATNEYNGHELECFKNQDTHSLVSYFTEYQELLLQILKAPQLVIIDQGKTFCTSLLDMAFACDIRISHQEISYNPDIRENSMLPTFGLTTLGSNLYGQAFIREILLSNYIDNKTTQRLSSRQYEDDLSKDEIMKQLLEQNCTYSGLSRIQTKSILLDDNIEQIEASFKRNVAYVQSTYQYGEITAPNEGDSIRVSPKVIQNSKTREDRSSRLRSV